VFPVLLTGAVHVPLLNHVDVNTSHAHGSVALYVFVPVEHSFTVVLTALAVGATLFHEYTADADELSFPKLSLTFARLVALLGQSCPGADTHVVVVPVRVHRVLPFAL
jgi:hypothetical protein